MTRDHICPECGSGGTNQSDGYRGGYVDCDYDCRTQKNMDLERWREQEDARRAAMSADERAAEDIKNRAMAHEAERRWWEGEAKKRRGE